MKRLLCLLVLLAGPSLAPAAGVLVEAISYTKPLPQNHIFVMLGDAEAERKATANKPDVAKKLEELRKQYPKSGVYVEATGQAVWQLPDTVFSPIDGTFISDDLKHLIRIEGDWWRTKDFPGGKRPAEAEIEKQLAGTAISFFEQGKLLKSYTLKDILTDPNQVMHSPDHLLWYASGSLNEATGRYLLFTQDANRVMFDYRTGELLSRSAVGLSNPLVTTILVVCGVSSVMIFLGWAYFVFVRKVAPAPQQV